MRVSARSTGTQELWRRPLIRQPMIALALVLGIAGARAGMSQEKRTGPAAPAAAKEAVDRYFRLNLDGSRLTPEGCAEVDKLRIGPAAQVPGKIDVIEKVALGEARVTPAGAAFVDVWYSQLGTLDTATALLRSPYPGMLIRGPAELELVGTQWKVVDPNTVAFIGVPAAEHYVQDLLANSKDPAVQRNAKRTLAALNKLAQ